MTQHESTTWRMRRYAARGFRRLASKLYPLKVEVTHPGPLANLSTWFRALRPMLAGDYAPEPSLGQIIQDALARHYAARRFQAHISAIIEADSHEEADRLLSEALALDEIEVVSWTSSPVSEDAE